MESFLRFLSGVWSGVAWMTCLLVVGMALGFPIWAGEGNVDLHDFAALGMLIACGRLALKRETETVVVTREVYVDLNGRTIPDAEFRVIN